MESVLVDTGVWYSLYDPRDRAADRPTVNSLDAQISSMSAVVPWPVTYETLRSQFVKNRIALEAFEKRLRSPRTVLLDDRPYREEALAYAFDSALRRRRPLSLVDCVIRLVLDQPATRIRYLATYNTRDFTDICRKRAIAILPA